MVTKRRQQSLTTPYAERLAEAMRDADMDVTRLKTHLSVSYQAVSKVLKGGSACLDTINNDKAALVLGVSPSWLARGVGPKRLDKNTAEHLRLMATSSWPFSRLSRADWDALGNYQVVVEHAAVEVARKLLLEVRSLSK